MARGEAAPGTIAPMGRRVEGVEVTVVLPTRDRWELAEAALQSALAQRAVSLETCVIDDGSVAVAPPGLTADSRVRLFRNDRPKGVAAGRNRGIREARGKWIAFLDDDDVWAPWHLERLLAVVRAEGTAWAFARYVTTDLRRMPIGNGPVPAVEADYERQFFRFNPVGTPSCAIVSAETVRSIGGFDEQLSVMADWDLWVRLAGVAPPAVSTSCSVGYAQHDGNMSRDVDRVRVEWRYMTRRHRRSLERLNIVFADNHYFWRWIADGYARRQRRLPAARFYLRAALRGGRGSDVKSAIRMIPGIGWPIRARRKVRGVVHRRIDALPEPWSGPAWLQTSSDWIAPGSEAEVAALDSSHRWRVRTRPSP